jgi:ankyrin repeat protein
MAAFHGCAGAVALLLAFKAKVDAADILDHTALRAAVDGSHPDIVSVLVAAGANLDMRGADGGTVLHYAAHIGCVDVLQRLLDAKANAAASVNSGRTPLCRATYVCNERAVQLLQPRP